jgi:DNA repair exonuclease SbcCD ATPase subunit
MTFKLKNITVKNFMSVGNQTQAVDFDKELLTLVLGSNQDLGGDDTGSRNGTGKTTIVNALSYALYGQALTNIKKENLINKTNGKGMLVTVEFEKSNAKYRIERGRKPNVLKLFVNDQELKSDSKDADDEAQGDSRETQKSIEQMLEMSHTMFKHLVALNTYTEPFLSMKAAEQREVIEQLLGITQLSEKAEALKTLLKETKDKIVVEQFRIEGIKSANENVQKSINSLQLKSSAWESKKESEIENFGKAIVNLESVDIDAELAAHVALKAWDEENTRIRNLNKQRATLESAVTQAERTLNRYIKEIESLADKKCPACEQDLHDHKHDEMITTANTNLVDAQTYFDKVNGDYKKIVKELGTGDQPHKDRKSVV